MKRLADIPNDPGFRFRGVTHTGDVIECIVVKVKETGLHDCRAIGENVSSFKLLKGWLPCEVK